MTKTTKYQLAVLPYSEIAKFQKEIPYPHTAKIYSLTEVEEMPTYLIIVRLESNVSHYEMVQVASRLEKTINVSKKFKVMLLAPGYSIELFKVEQLGPNDSKTIGVLYEQGFADGLMNKKQMLEFREDEHYCLGYSSGSKKRTQYQATMEELDDDE